MEEQRQFHLGVLLLLHICIVGIHGVRFEVSSGQSKCLAEELHRNAIVVGNYHVVTENAPNISVAVTSPYGVRMHYLDQIHRGSFAFTAKDPGNHIICFWSAAAAAAGTTVTVELDWRTGVAAKDWASIAKKEKIDGVHLELRKLEDSVEAVHEEMLYLRDQEEHIHSLNETTYSKLAGLTLITLFSCLVMALLQVWHLRLFFQKKKLL